LLQQQTTAVAVVTTGAIQSCSQVAAAATDVSLPTHSFPHMPDALTDARSTLPEHWRYLSLQEVKKDKAVVTKYGKPYYLSFKRHLKAHLFRQ